MFKCYICNSGKYHSENVSKVFQLNGKFYLVENIPATVCSQCLDIVREKIF